MADLEEFPVVLTRDLATARAWLRQRSQMHPQRRCGLLASSGALRLRADGLELSTAFRRGYPYDHWFLGGPEDLRSSFALEVAATEFECQGLELDWIAVCWGNDLTVSPDSKWQFRRLAGSKWRRVKDAEARQYMLNKYRVLLSRARQGLAIWVPRVPPHDPTRCSESLNRTHEYLLSASVTPIET
jgi:hypothetical protein